MAAGRLAHGAAGAFIAALCLAPAVVRADATHTVVRALVSGGRTRSYRLHVPPGLAAGRPAPLVLAFHGGGSTAEGMERYCGLSALSDSAGFIVVYPEAVNRHWNDGRGTWRRESDPDTVEDLEFAVALLDALAREVSVDRGRVFATGISNGGFFCEHLAARRADRIAAIACVAGGMGPAIAAAFAPARPVSVLMIHGTEDPLVPYGGGPVARTRGRTIPVEEIVRRWVAHDGCRPRPTTEALQDRDPADGTRVRRSLHPGGREGTEVALYRIEGGGHTWPGALQYLPAAFIGRTCRDFDARRLVWEFFAAHPRR